MGTLATVAALAFMAGLSLGLAALSSRNALLARDWYAEREARREAQMRAELLRRQLEREGDRRDETQRLLGATIRDWHEVGGLQ